MLNKFETSEKGAFKLEHLIEDLDEDSVRLFMEIFLQESPQVMGDMEFALNNGDLAKAMADAHQLKGNAGYLGADVFAKTLQEFEHHCRMGRVECCFPVLRELTAEYQALTSNMCQYLTEHSEPAHAL